MMELEEYFKYVKDLRRRFKKGEISLEEAMILSDKKFEEAMKKEIV